LGSVAGQSGDRNISQPIIWNFDQLDLIGGHKPTALGAPTVIDTLQGKAVQFNGRDDGLLIDANPLAGLKEFTAEVIFQPTADGPKEQRFLHFQEHGSENRLLFETRLIDGNRWFLDTFIKSGEGNYTLFAERSPHPIGPWYHAAVVVDGKTMRHFVNGSEELSIPIRFEPLKAGRASAGVRLNKVSWHKGAIRQVRVTPRPLTPDKFLKP
jgi:hypothetical protein